MTKTLKDVLSGVKASTVLPQTLGKDPGVDYKPKSGDEADFADKHKIERHDDRVGNGDDVYQATNVKHSLADPKEKKHGYKKPEDKKVNEAKVTDEAKCNMTTEGTNCPVHGLKKCSSMQPIKELSKKTLGSYVQSATRNALSRQYALGKGDKSDTNKLMNRRKGIDKAVDKLVKENEQIDEADPLKARERLTPHIKKDEYGKSTAHKHLKSMIKSAKGNHAKPNLPEEVEEIDELSTDLLHRAAHKAAKVAMTDVQGRSGPIFKKRAAQANKFRAKGMEQEKQEKAAKNSKSAKIKAYRADRDKHMEEETVFETAEYMIAKHPTKGYNVTLKKVGAPGYASLSQDHGYHKTVSSAKSFAKKHAGDREHKISLGHNVSEEVLDEVLTKSTTAGETIDDFVHSDNPKFKGKSKEKRKQMALAAYYQKQNEETGPVAPVPTHLDSHGIAKKFKSFVTGGGSTKTLGHYNTYVRLHAKKTGKHPDAINKEVRKHVEKMNEDLAVPLLGGDSKRDESAEMVKTELKALANKAMHLMMQMPESMHVEPWCQAKIAQAKSMVSDVHDYMIYGDHDKPEEDEQAETPITFPNMANDSAAGINV
jgi:hypothetical protein